MLINNYTLLYIFKIIEIIKKITEALKQDAKTIPLSDHSTELQSRIIEISKKITESLKHGR